MLIGGSLNAHTRNEFGCSGRSKYCLIMQGYKAFIVALQSGAITVLQHREAIEACEKLEKFLRENSTAVLDWCSAMQRKLKREMPV